MKDFENTGRGSEIDRALDRELVASGPALSSGFTEKVMSSIHSLAIEERAHEPDQPAYEWLWVSVVLVASVVILGLALWPYLGSGTGLVLDLESFGMLTSLVQSLAAWLLEIQFFLQATLALFCVFLLDRKLGSHGLG